MYTCNDIFIVPFKNKKDFSAKKIFSYICYSDSVKNISPKGVQRKEKHYGKNIINQ